MIMFKSPEVLFKNSISPVQSDVVTAVAYADVITKEQDTTYAYPIKTTKIKSLRALIPNTIFSSVVDGIKVEDTWPVSTDYRYIVQNGGSRDRVLNHNNAYKGTALAIGLDVALNFTGYPAKNIILNYTRNSSWVQYGGDSYYERINSIYMGCGNLMNTTVNTTTVYGGDTYIGMFEYLSAMQYSEMPGGYHSISCT